MRKNNNLIIMPSTICEVIPNYFALNYNECVMKLFTNEVEEKIYLMDSDIQSKFDVFGYTYFSDSEAENLKDLIFKIIAIDKSIFMKLKLDNIFFNLPKN